MRRLAPLACLVLLIAAACNGLASRDAEEVLGSSNRVVETREVAEFSEVVLAGEGALLVSFDGDGSLSIEIDDNLSQHIETVVENGRLVIRTEDGIDIDPSEPPTYRVGVADLSGLELSGAGSIDVGSWQGGNVWLTMSGVGEIRVDELEARDLRADMSGVGAIVVSGEVDTQGVVADGVGSFEGADLQSRMSDVTAAGSGTVRVWATELLTVVADGLGKVEYYGPGELLPQTDGLATVAYLGDK